MAAHKQRKFSSRGRSPASESRQTDSSPIRATVALSEQYYVAVDRQPKSGFGTYEAAEKAAKEIKKRHPNPQVPSLMRKSVAIPPLNNRQHQRHGGTESS